jgi:hypothetical protein
MNSTSHISFIAPSAADASKAFRTSSADALLLKALRTPATLFGAAFRTDVFCEPLFARICRLYAVLVSCAEVLESV